MALIKYSFPLPFLPARPPSNKLFVANLANEIIHHEIKGMMEMHRRRKVSYVTIKLAFKFDCCFRLPAQRAGEEEKRAADVFRFGVFRW